MTSEFILKGLVAKDLLSWTTANRPSSPVVGVTGYNTDLGTYELWNGSTWEPINNRFISTNGVQNITINPTSGDDNLTDAAYPLATFLTLHKALDWISKSSSSDFAISLVGSNSGTPVLSSVAVSLVGKYITIGTGYIIITQSITFKECVVDFTTVTLECRASQSLALRSSNIYLNQGEVIINSAIPAYTGVIGTFFNSSVVIGGNHTITYGANNQCLIFNGASASTIVNFVSSHLGSSKTFNTGSFTGCTLISSDLVGTPYSINAAQILVPGLLKGTTLNHSFVMNNATFGINTIVQRGRDGFTFGNLTNNDYNKQLALHGTKPIYAPNQQTYETNNLAIAGGLNAGEHYKTSTGELRTVVASGLVRREIMWKAWSPNDTPANLVIDIVTNTTGRTLSWNNSDTRFELSGAYTDDFIFTANSYGANPYDGCYKTRNTAIGIVIIGGVTGLISSPWAATDGPNGRIAIFKIEIWE